MTREELLQRILKLESCRGYFAKYQDVILKADRCYQKEEWEECEKLLSSLPTEEKLCESLVSKLQNKHFVQTLKKISEGEIENPYTAAKGISSLLTHVLIECEKGNLEYSLLIDHFYQMLSDILFSLKT